PRSRRDRRPVPADGDRRRPREESGRGRTARGRRRRGAARSARADAGAHRAGLSARQRPAGWSGRGMPFRGLFALPSAAPAGMFVCHAIAYRVMSASGRRPTAHTSAFAAIAAWFIITLLAAGALLAGAAGTVPVWSLAAGAAYVVATYGALAILYVDAVNIAETSLHMHVLLEVMWSERPSLARLIDRYGAERMIAERLERLTALGQVRES